MNLTKNIRKIYSVYNERKVTNMKDVNKVDVVKQGLIERFIVSHPKLSLGITSLLAGAGGVFLGYVLGGGIEDDSIDINYDTDNKTLTITEF